MDKPSANVQIAESAKIIEEIIHLERYHEAKVQASSSNTCPGEPAVHFGMKSAACAALINSDSVHSAARPSKGMAHRWVPPASVHEDDDDYNSVLREDGSLLVTASGPLWAIVTHKCNKQLSIMPT